MLLKQKKKKKDNCFVKKTIINFSEKVGAHGNFPVVHTHEKGQNQ